MQKHSAWLLFGTVVLAGLGLWTGCDNTVDPFAEERGQFSIQGVLTLSQEEHFIRVKDLNDPLIGDSTRTLDVTVTLENQATGTTERLADSIVAFDGLFTHNFRTDQDIQPGVTYELTVERPDGRSSQATATMPPETRVESRPPRPDSIRCSGGLILRFQNVPKGRFLRVFAGFNWNRAWRWAEIQDPETSIGIEPARFVEKVIPNRVFRAELGSNWQEQKRLFCTLLDKGRIRIAYTHFGPDWPPDSVLANPIESSVRNGLGVFGGVHRDTLSRVLTPGPDSEEAARP